MTTRANNKRQQMTEPIKDRDDLEWYCDVYGCLGAWKKGLVTAEVAIDRIHNILIPAIVNATGDST